MGNSCFLSAALQIFNSTSLFQTILKGDHNCVGIVDCYFCLLRNISYKLHTSSDVSPKSLYPFFINKSFKIGGQNDAHEIYFKMMEMADLQTLNRFSAATTFKVQVELQCLKCNYERANHPAATHQFILNLRDECSLKELLENSFNAETAVCPQCGSSRALRNNSLVTTPKVLQIYVTKSDKTQKIEVETSLKLNGEKFILKGALIHEGSLKQGHYTSVKWSEQTSSYHLASDLKVKELNTIDLRSRLSIAIFFVYEETTRKRKLLDDIFDDIFFKVERIIFDECKSKHNTSSSPECKSTHSATIDTNPPVAESIPAVTKRPESSHLSKSS